MTEMREIRRVMVIDDSPLQCMIWKKMLVTRYGDRAAVETYTSPKEALKALSSDIHVVLLDWEMPEMDGLEVFQEAVAQGYNPKRIIITSGHSANRLHEIFDDTECLAVIEKVEPEQQAAFLMIMDSIMKR